jgi:PKHD-type hydroxylase
MVYYENLYWYFTSALTPKICNKIIKVGQQSKLMMARTGNFSSDKFKTLNKKQKKNLKKDRDSYVSFIDQQWLYNLLFPYVNTANEMSGWKHQVDWAEPIQFTKYKKNQHYTWHNDVGNGKQFESESTKGKIRKLSLVVCLSDEKDYEGGDFCFQFRNTPQADVETTVKEIKTRGTVVVFPSYLWHTVKPVIKGTRYSLVMWVCGYPYK